MCKYSDRQNEHEIELHTLLITMSGLELTNFHYWLVYVSTSLRSISTGSAGLIGVHGEQEEPDRTIVPFDRSWIPNTPWSLSKIGQIISIQVDKAIRLRQVDLTMNNREFTIEMLAWCDILMLSVVMSWGRSWCWTEIVLRHRRKEVPESWPSEIDILWNRPRDSSCAVKFGQEAKLIYLGDSGNEAVDFPGTR